jgi:pimeloyl-ACP methyl ester carboxylesterase
MQIAFANYGSGKPIILLHAFPLSGKMWKANIESLVKANYRVIAPDLRGFGKTSNFADLNSVEEMARDIAELMDNLKIEKAVIGGLSMGGYVAFNFFRLFPQRIAALVLCDTNSASDTEEKRKSRYETIEKIEAKGSQFLIENMLPNLVSDFTKYNNKDLMKNLEQMFSEADPNALAASLRGMAERESHDELLKTINVPTILIFGAEDSITNLNVARSMKSQIPFSKLSVIENAGHYCNLEQPERFDAELLDFLQNAKI